MAANTESSGVGTFRFFEASNEKSNVGGLGFFDFSETVIPPPPLEVLPSEVSESVRCTMEKVDLGFVTLLKGRVSMREVFKLSNSDLVPRKYEASRVSFRPSLLHPPVSPTFLAIFAVSLSLVVQQWRSPTMAANTESSGVGTFRFFEASNEKSNVGGLGFFDFSETVIPPPPLEVLPSEVSESVRCTMEKVDLGFVTLLKGRVSMREVFKLSNSDLVPRKYEGGLKFWECSLDLVKALDSEIQKGYLSFEGKSVLPDSI